MENPALGMLVVFISLFCYQLQDYPPAHLLNVQAARFTVEEPVKINVDSQGSTIINTYDASAVKAETSHQEIESDSNNQALEEMLQKTQIPDSAKVLSSLLLNSPRRKLQDAACDICFWCNFFCSTGCPAGCRVSAAEARNTHMRFNYFYQCAVF